MFKYEGGKLIVKKLIVVFTLVFLLGLLNACEQPEEITLTQQSSVKVEGLIEEDKPTNSEKSDEKEDLYNSGMTYDEIL